MAKVVMSQGLQGTRALGPNKSQVSHFVAEPVLAYAYGKAW